MTTVAARYGISANYLARVCAHLNVPHPPRGYWAKLKVGRGPKQPDLPPARPGEVLEWRQGDSVPRQTLAPASRTNQVDNNETKAQPDRHELVRGVRQHFEAGRLSETGYLRPLKRNLVDIFVSQSTLSYALETANNLFLLLEQRGHRVALASGGEYVHRPELSVYEGQKFDYYNREPWTPGRATLVWVDSLAFGLTLFESTDHVEVTYEWDRPIRYVRTTEDTKRRSSWSIANTTYKQHMPSGRLILRA